VAFRPEDVILWDFWLAPRRSPDDLFHLFFLQAPRSLSDPEMRHDRATIGHAVSTDLHHWEPRGTAFVPGPDGAWDDFSIWTGSVIEHERRWWFFYTGRNRQENGRVQRIGLAISDDLESWQRVTDGPILEADPRWHVSSSDDARQVDCRDPWVIWHDDRWLMYYTASGRETAFDGRGVVGLAESQNLIEWTPLPPIVMPGEFGEIEVPQVVELGGRWRLLFCTAQHADQRLARAPQSNWNGTHYFNGLSPSGPFELTPDEPFAADESGSLYAGRLVLDPWMPPVFLAWRRWDDQGQFAGDLIDPIPVKLTDNDELRLVRA
jgi:beta-fructofuranosidase